MKSLIFSFLLAFATTSNAAVGFFSDSSLDSLQCNNFKLYDDGNQFECTDYKKLEKLKNALIGPAVTSDHKINLEWAGAVEFGVLPDDSTNLAYSYTRTLLDPQTKKLVGYTVIEMYYNTEMEVRVKLNLRFTPKGKLISGKAVSI